jgi:hypothetical protein
MRILKQAIFILLILSSVISCKTTKNIDKGSTSVDSIEVMRVDTVTIHKTDSIGVVKYDSGSTKVAIINFNYDTVVRKPYVSKITVYEKKNDKGKIVEKVHKVDSTASKKKDSTKLIETTNHFNKQVVRKGIAWWDWLILIPIGIVIFIGIKYWNKIKLIFNVFS